MKLLVLLLLLTVSACTATHSSLYQQLGGKQKVAEIVDNFVYEIEYDTQILPYFEGSNIDRFKEKLSEQICSLSGGPCEYTGDSMAQVHTGMNITEAHFNRTVDLLINAMNKADVPHRLQNQLLAKLAPTRKEMLYL
ncbi:group I truncated hemoglobin [Alteromonas ponticola]|uniref:Group 1 truncated hemoglobin n=1 Tax=Alteromonas ponticola TaxID=2720613 RepID=A0ABX1R0B4_9ALTE|nr:group 1 truncated hemoglobin [Alteromonas ponticola]NMH59910.1 group 1 truncated hemoglobin [Alteromonas ponticola]